LSERTPLLGEQEDLHEQRLELRKELFSKGGNGVMVRRVIAGEETEGSGFPGGLLDLSRGEDAGGVGIEEQSDHHFGGIGCPASFAIGGIEGSEVELLDDIDDEACEMARRQAIAQTHAGVEGGLVVEGFE
jgi:hypothetical protein